MASRDLEARVRGCAHHVLWRELCHALLGEAQIALRVLAWRADAASAWFYRDLFQVTLRCASLTDANEIRVGSSRLRPRAPPPPPATPLAAADAAQR